MLELFFITIFGTYLCLYLGLYLSMSNEFGGDE